MLKNCFDRYQTELDRWIIYEIGWLFMFEFDFSLIIFLSFTFSFVLVNIADYG